MIKLRRAFTNPRAEYWVRPDAILYMCRPVESDYTTIRLSYEVGFEVIETPEEIFELIKKAQEAKDD